MAELLLHDMDSGAPIYHARLRELLSYWRSLPRQGEFPPRTAIDPLDIPALLANTVLIDVEGSPPRFRFRLVGSAIVDFIGTPCKGRRVEETRLHHEGGAEEMLRDYRTVVETRQFVCSRRSLPDGKGRNFVCECLLLPLAENGQAIDCLLGGMYFDEQPVKLPRLRGLF